MRYLIPSTINNHIDCSKHSESVFGAFSKQQQGALKVCCAAFSVRIWQDKKIVGYVVAWFFKNEIMTYSDLTKMVGVFY